MSLAELNVGLCSTLQDLSIYMKDHDLTKPVRECGMLTVVDEKVCRSLGWELLLSRAIQLAMDCLLKIGFTYPCAQIWMFDAINTRKHCFVPCIGVYQVRGTPHRLLVMYSVQKCGLRTNPIIFLRTRRIWYGIVCAFGCIVCADADGYCRIRVLSATKP